jgi:glyoxylase-like metal-dependent hydrolase (beta-lactamase superfamily II)
VTFKPPRLLLDGLYAFAPNRATLGGTAYFILSQDGTGAPINYLIDAPAYDAELLEFFAKWGGVQQWMITHRGAIGEAKALQAALQCEVIIHEQEAYLLPDVAGVKTFQHQRSLSGGEIFWTPGHSPGSACVYLPLHGGVLFTGRHLLPDAAGQLQPLRFAKTFHWPRQLQQVESLQTRFSSDTLTYICPGANTGFLRGQGIVKQAYQQLQAIAITPPDSEL